MNNRRTTAMQTLPYAALMVVGLLAPIILLLTYSFRNTSYLGMDEGYTLEHYLGVFRSSSAILLQQNTLLIGFGTAAVVTFLSFVTAYGMRFRMGVRAASVAMVIVLATAIASYLVRVFAWGTILGTNGLVNVALMSLGLISGPLEFLFFGYFAILVTVTSIYLPIGVLLTYSAMEAIDKKTLEASNDLGVGAVETALRVVAPQARVGIVTTFTLISILACWDYIAPSLVGGVHGQMIVSVRS